MESFNANLQGGKKLVKSLEKQSVRSAPAARALLGTGRHPNHGRHGYLFLVIPAHGYRERPGI